MAAEIEEQLQKKSMWEQLKTVEILEPELRKSKKELSKMGEIQAPCPHWLEVTECWRTEESQEQHTPETH